MKSSDIFFSAAREDHEVRNASVISGALLGATTGIVGGLVGVGVAGVAGALLGALGGVILERQLRKSEQVADDEIDAASLIEPPCPDCVEVRASSGGTAAWCARHSHPHAMRHEGHYAYPQSFAMGSMLFRPTF